MSRDRPDKKNDYGKWKARLAYKTAAPYSSTGAATTLWGLGWGGDQTTG